MVLCLKARESRSSPGLPRALTLSLRYRASRCLSAFIEIPLFHDRGLHEYKAAVGYPPRRLFMALLAFDLLETLGEDGRGRLVDPEGRVRRARGSARGGASRIRRGARQPCTGRRRDRSR